MGNIKKLDDDQYKRVQKNRVSFMKKVGAVVSSLPASTRSYRDSLYGSANQTPRESGPLPTGRSNDYSNYEQSETPKFKTMDESYQAITNSNVT